jgi:hypothetical protein
MYDLVSISMTKSVHDNRRNSLLASHMMLFFSGSISSFPPPPIKATYDGSEQDYSSKAIRYHAHYGGRA